MWISIHVCSWGKRNDHTPSDRTAYHLGAEIDSKPGKGTQVENHAHMRRAIIKRAYHVVSTQALLRACNCQGQLHVRQDIGRFCFRKKLQVSVRVKRRHTRKDSVNTNNARYCCRTEGNSPFVMVKRRIVTMNRIQNAGQTLTHIQKHKC